MYIVRLKKKSKIYISYCNVFIQFYSTLHSSVLILIYLPAYLLTYHFGLQVFS